MHKKKFIKLFIPPRMREHLPADICQHKIIMSKTQTTAQNFLLYLTFERSIIVKPTSISVKHEYIFTFQKCHGIEVKFLLILFLSIKFTTGCLYELRFRVGSHGNWRSPGVVSHGRNVNHCIHSECKLNSCHNNGSCIDHGASFR